jgi:parvulin-like peptidyl-prolyl isomerase
MMSLLRKHRQWLMTVIAILALPFVFYFVKTDIGAMRSDQVARIYGRGVSSVETTRGGHLLELALALGMQRFVQTLAAGAENRDDAHNFFTLNLIILRHEAERLGIRPTPADIADFVRNLAVFRGPSGFDSKKYDELTKYALGPNGLSEAQLEELATDELCLNRIKDLVTIGMSVPENESKTTYEQANGKLFASVIRLRTADFAKDIKVTDEEITKYFELHKDALKTDEKRKVEFVGLFLNDAQKKLTGKERVEVLQKLADRANELTQALSEKGADFHQTAAKFQLPVDATGEFTASAPDPKIKDPQLGATAFQLTAEEPNSEPVQTTDGFYVLHLVGTVKERPLTLEEAKPKIVDAIKATRGRELLSNKGAKTAHDLREALKTGEALPAACQKANVKAEKIPPFTLMDDVDPTDPNKSKDKPPDFLAARSAVAGLQPGDVSEFLPWQEGGIIAVLEKREPPDEAKYRESKAAFDERILNNKKEIVFYEWLRERQREARLVTAKSATPSSG